jgi:hypothetical protein
MFQSKHWVGVKKHIPVPEAMAIFKPEIFLIIGKTGTVLLYQERQEKRPLVCTFSFFFASLWKRKPNYQTHAPK